MAITPRFFIKPRAWPSPMVVVVLPSPNLVGVIAVTKMSFPSGSFSRRR